LPISMIDLTWGRPDSSIRHPAAAVVNRFVPGRILRRTSRVRTMKRIWIGLKLAARDIIWHATGKSEPFDIFERAGVYIG